MLTCPRSPQCSHCKARDGGGTCEGKVCIKITAPSTVYGNITTHYCRHNNTSLLGGWVGGNRCAVQITTRPGLNRVHEPPYTLCKESLLQGAAIKLILKGHPSFAFGPSGRICGHDWALEGYLPSSSSTSPMPYHMTHRHPTLGAATVVSVGPQCAGPKQATVILDPWSPSPDRPDVMNNL